MDILTEGNCRDIDINIGVSPGGVGAGVSFKVKRCEKWDPVHRRNPGDMGTVWSGSLEGPNTRKLGTSINTGFREGYGIGTFHAFDFATIK